MVDLTTFTKACAVLYCFMADAANEDIKVRFASAAVTNRKVSSPPFSLERPENSNTSNFKVGKKPFSHKTFNFYK